MAQAPLTNAVAVTFKFSSCWLLLWPHVGIPSNNLRVVVSVSTQFGPVCPYRNDRPRPMSEMSLSRANKM